MKIQERSGLPVLHPEGELTIFEAALFKEALQDLCKHEGSIELDLSDIERVDSSGIQLMVAAAQDSRLVITGMNDGVSEKITAIGCESLVKNTKKCD
ncbi:MAG: STAS domain-containing protein [Nitrospirales bacterium]